MMNDITSEGTGEKYRTNETHVAPTVDHGKASSFHCLGHKPTTVK